MQNLQTFWDRLAEAFPDKDREDRCVGFAARDAVGDQRSALLLRIDVFAFFLQFMEANERRMNQQNKHNQQK